MRSTQEWSLSIQSLIAPYALNNNQVAFNYHSEEEATTRLGEIRQLRKQLRQRKNDFLQVIKEIRQSFTNQKARVEAPLVLKLISKKQAGRYVSKKRESLHRKEETTLRPYQVVIQEVDHLLVSLDDIEQKITREFMGKVVTNSSPH